MRGNYLDLREHDTVNGPGVRVSIFLSGCPLRCKGCFNPASWNPKNGNPLTEKEIEIIKNALQKPWISGLSILGGEPFAHPELGSILKTLRPYAKTIWVWTGYELDEIKDRPELEYIDVLVWGRFRIDLKDPDLIYCGSSNQVVWDVQKWEPAKILTKA